MSTNDNNDDKPKRSLAQKLDDILKCEKKKVLIEVQCKYCGVRDVIETIQFMGLVNRVALYCKQCEKLTSKTLEEFKDES